MKSGETVFNITLVGIMSLGLLFSWLSEHEKKPMVVKPENKIVVTVKCGCIEGEKNVLQGKNPNALGCISSVRR